MKDGGLYLMVEVKTVFGKEEYAAAERVDGKKIQKMIHAAERYFYDLNISEYNVRFDAVTVSGTDLNKPHIEHYKNII
jgi:Holliday junction resolvase-like predicted endonuclease